MTTTAATTTTTATTIPGANPRPLVRKAVPPTTSTHSAVRADTTAELVRTEALRKVYGEQVAVDALDLTVRAGEVYGFLGPNGAGKTTTLRMLVGLIRPTSGRATVMGHAPGTPESLVQIGSMIETPAFYPFLSGEDNLRLLARYAGIPSARIGTVLEQVDLLSRGGDAFKSYSLGMKQRRGVAAAVLKDPALLILDEPTNGLDPAGMAEMRSLIRELGKGNRSVLLSSHLMHEVEQISDRVGIIARGKVVAEGTVDDLRGDDHLLVRVDPDRVDAVGDALGNLPWLRVVPAPGTSGAVRIDTRARVPANDALDAAAINTRLVTSGIAVHELRMERASLESVFFALTGTPGYVPEGSEESHA